MVLGVYYLLNWKQMSCRFDTMLLLGALRIPVNIALPVGLVCHCCIIDEVFQQTTCGYMFWIDHLSGC
jgi:hypothetical protein